MTARTGRLRLHEPTTTLTDWLITAVAGWLAARLASHAATLAVALLAGALAAVALTALVGGVVHGLGPALGERRKRPLWQLTLQLAGVANALLLAAAVAAHVPAAARAPLLAVVVVKLLRFSWAAWRHATFAVVVLDSLLALAGVALLAGLAWAQGGAPSAPWMLAGVAASVLGGAVQRARLAPHRHFNHNDLYHLVQLAGVWLFYRGGLLLAAP